MYGIPGNIFEILEFDKVLTRLQEYCIGPSAAAICPGIVPETHVERIRHELSCAEEAQRILSGGLNCFSHAYTEISEILNNLSVEGYILEGEDILEIYRLLELAAEARVFFNEARSIEFPNLSAIVRRDHDPAPVLTAIQKIIDDSGHVRSDASKELIRISREIQSVGHQCDAVFEKLVRQYSAKDWLADTLESIRNDKRVLAVRAEFKRQIKGIPHDQSASGRIVFVEPAEVIGINNDLFDLRGAYKAEVRQLLRQLCDMLRTKITDIGNARTHVTELDLHFAKGHLAKAMHAHVPVLDKSPRLSIRRAQHPLLLLKNLSAEKKTVPFDLDLHPPNRILLLSGPNAGGKSILMKAVGLLQLMVQSGIPVPVSPDSVFGIFTQLSVSLGDHQSIENDLSTYGSKLMEMRQCIEHAGEQSLVLIDELGSGTDPKLGGAIAEGILEVLCARQVFGVMTTHYSELKVYAYKKRGIVNGAMVFDKQHMAPTYELRVGKPGSSFTFEIARKSGIPEEILHYAGTRTGNRLRTMEELLTDLDRQKVKLDETLRQAEQRSQQLDQLIQSYERLQNDLTAQRHRLRLEQKEKEYAHLSQMNRDLERSIRSLREEKDLDATKEKLKEVRQLQSEARENIVEIQTVLRARRKADKPFQPGDPVRMHSGTQVGRIERITGKKATVIIGQIRMEVSVDELVSAKDPLDIRSERSVQSDLETQTRFDPKLDLRGMRPEEAEALLERFMDMALLVNVHSVEIIHGKGTGALRKLVHKKLKEYTVKEVTQPIDQHGGSGSTVVSL